MQVQRTHLVSVMKSWNANIDLTPSAAATCANSGQRWAGPGNAGPENRHERSPPSVGVGFQPSDSTSRRSRSYCLHRATAAFAASSEPHT